MKQGNATALADFTGLVEDYSKCRRGYSKSVLTAVLALSNKPISEVKVVDLGAGAGIWSRILARQALEKCFGAWCWVNDVQARFGAGRRPRIMSRFGRRMLGVLVMETVIFTRAWTVRLSG